MDLFLPDKQIEELLAEEKRTNILLRDLWSLKDKRSHRENDLIIPREDGSQFKIILRQNTINVLDFSVILAFTPKGSNQDFKLCRYNGKSHQHSNKIEKQTFYDFHIHQAKERYQRAGFKEESYAETTTRYSDIKTAFTCMVTDYNIVFENDNQLDFNF